MMEHNPHEVVLLATRLGEGSRGPAAAARRLARATAAPLVVVSIVPDTATLASQAPAADVDPAAMKAVHEETIARQTREFLAHHLPGVDARVIVRTGNVAEAIAATAEQVGATFVVIGTQERSKLSRFLLGDTTREILEAVQVPVLVVPVNATT